MSVTSEIALALRDARSIASPYAKWRDDPDRGRAALARRFDAALRNVVTTPGRSTDGSDAVISALRDARAIASP